MRINRIWSTFSGQRFFAGWQPQNDYDNRSAKYRHPVKYVSIICFIVVAVDFFSFALAFRYFIFIFIHFYLRTHGFRISHLARHSARLCLFISYNFYTRRKPSIYTKPKWEGDREQDREGGRERARWIWSTRAERFGHIHRIEAHETHRVNEGERKIFGVSVVDVRIFHYVALAVNTFSILLGFCRSRFCCFACYFIEFVFEKEEKKNKTKKKKREFSSILFVVQYIFFSISVAS